MQTYNNPLTMEHHYYSPIKIPLTYVTNAKNERTFEVSEELMIQLSDGRYLQIPKGFKTDLISVPSILWSIIRPIDKAFIADLIHDKLWKDNVAETQHFKGAYQARKFADEERLRWRMALAPKKRLKNYVTHYVLRLIGGFYYSRQFQIPK